MNEIERDFHYFYGLQRKGNLSVPFSGGTYLFAGHRKGFKIRRVLLESSLVITVLFFFPLFKMVMDKVEEAGTYYRILWLLPMTVVIAYAGVKLIGRHTRIGLAAMVIVLVLGGEYLYKSQYVTRAENRYHLPQAVIAICDLIAPQEDEERVWAVFPSELIHFVRQYSSEIQMPYGRDMVVASWEHVEHPMYALMESDIVRIDLLAELADDYQCQYIILNKAKQTEGDPEACGLEKIAEVGGYDVFRNVSVEIKTIQ